jgi:formate dehydrogenase maturation protein FdhE
MTLQEIERRNPEWRPWLDAIRELLEQVDDPQWDAGVPNLECSQNEKTPLVAYAKLDPAHVPMPLLHACRRRWTVSASWSQGYCPLCGAWPAFAELCGVERSRYLRCVRCGSAWRAHGLACPFCGARDHAALASLVAEEGRSSWAIEVCNSCTAYLKVFTALRPGPAENVLLQDLATVELDLAAEARGYRRPERPPFVA